MHDTLHDTDKGEKNEKNKNNCVVISLSHTSLSLCCFVVDIIGQLYRRSAAAAGEPVPISPPETKIGFDCLFD